MKDLMSQLYDSRKAMSKKHKRNDGAVTNSGERRDTAESKHGNHEKDARANRSKQNQIININGYMATD